MTDVNILNWARLCESYSTDIDEHIVGIGADAHRSPEEDPEYLDYEARKEYEREREEQDNLLPPDSSDTYSDEEPELPKTSEIESLLGTNEIGAEVEDVTNSVNGHEISINLNNNRDVELAVHLLKDNGFNVLEDKSNLSDGFIVVSV